VIPDMEPLGEVILSGPSFSGVQFTTDPGQLRPVWRPRRAVYSGPGGWTLAQDSDNTIGDLVIELGSTETTPLSRNVVVDILKMQRIVGEQWSYVDSFDTVAQVIIMEFLPSYRGSGLWDYSLRLQVRSATSILGDTELAADP
jgi:hypothetical protein